MYCKWCQTADLLLSTDDSFEVLEPDFCWVYTRSANGNIVINLFLTVKKNEENSVSTCISKSCEHYERNSLGNGLSYVFKVVCTVVAHCTSDDTKYDIRNDIDCVIYRKPK